MLRQAHVILADIISRFPSVFLFPLLSRVGQWWNSNHNAIFRSKYYMGLKIFVWYDVLRRDTQLKPIPTRRDTFKKQPLWGCHPIELFQYSYDLELELTTAKVLNSRFFYCQNPEIKILDCLNPIQDFGLPNSWIQDMAAVTLRENTLLWPKVLRHSRKPNGF